MSFHNISIHNNRTPSIKEEENTVNEGECDMDSSNFRESFVSRFRVRAKEKKYSVFFFLSNFV
jgi:hypothetical protein